MNFCSGYSEENTAQKARKNSPSQPEVAIIRKKISGAFRFSIFLRKNSKVWNRICKGGHKSRNSFKSIVPDLPGHDLKLSRDEIGQLGNGNVCCLMPLCRQESLGWHVVMKLHLPEVHLMSFRVSE